MHCILYGSFLHFTRAMVRTSRTTMLTILQCFVLIVFVFGEKTENFKVNEVEVNKEKPEVSPPKAVVSSALVFKLPKLLSFHGVSPVGKVSVG